MPDDPKCRYPDPDEFPEECGHYDRWGICRRDGRECVVFDERGNDDGEKDEGKTEAGNDD